MQQKSLKNYALTLKYCQQYEIAPWKTKGPSQHTTKGDTMTDEPKPSITPLTRLMRATFYVRNALKNTNLSFKDQKIFDDLVMCANNLAKGISDIRDEMADGTINFKEAQQKINELLLKVSQSVNSPDPEINTKYKDHYYSQSHSEEKWKYPTDQDVLRISEEIAKMITVWSKRFVPQKTKDWNNK